MSVNYQTSCNVCGSSTIAIARRKYDLEMRTTWANESTMKLLGLTEVEGTLRACLRCLHVFRSPLFDESRIYGEEGSRLRKEAFEKYFPGRKYVVEGAGSLRSLSSAGGNMLAYVSRLVAWVSSVRRIRSSPPTSLKILDWGGGDGFVGESIAAAFSRVFKVETRSFCFDYHESARDSKSPYFEYITSAQLPDVSPFDIVILSHVLEHTESPGELLRRATKYLAEDGVVLVAVPYEQPEVILRPNAFMNYHQSAFSATSLRRLLAGCGFTESRVKTTYLSYRGSPMWNILAAATRHPGKSRTLFAPITEFVTFSKVTVHTLITLINSRN